MDRWIDGWTDGLRCNRIDNWMPPLANVIQHSYEYYHTSHSLLFHVNHVCTNNHFKDETIF